MAGDLKGSHSFTCTHRVHPLTEWTIPALPRHHHHHFIVNKAWQNAHLHMRKTVKQLWNGETVAMPNGRVKINKAWNLFPHFVFQICFRCCSIVIFLCDRSAWSQVVCGSRSTKSLWHNPECLILPLAVVTSRVSHTMYYPSFLTQFCCLLLAVVFLLIFI